MSNVRALYRLQLVDSEADETSRRLSEVEAQLGASDEALQAQAAVAEVVDKLAGLRVHSRNLEMEIASLNAKLKQNQERLYGGQVRNPKELSSLQEEAGALRRRQAELEDRQLELMIEIEGEEAELAERQARLQQIEMTWRVGQAGLRGEQESLTSHLSVLQSKRQSLRSGLKLADLRLYDDLRESLGGVGVAVLKGGMCQACCVDVPTTLARAVERGEGEHYCPICGRLLYGGQ